MCWMVCHRLCNRLRQIRLRQRRDPVAPLPAVAGGVPDDPDRSENAGILGL